MVGVRTDVERVRAAWPAAGGGARVEPIRLSLPDEDPAPGGVDDGFPPRRGGIARGGRAARVGGSGGMRSAGRSRRVACRSLFRGCGWLGSRFVAAGRWWRAGRGAGAVRLATARERGSVPPRRWSLRSPRHSLDPEGCAGADPRPCRPAVQPAHAPDVRCSRPRHALRGIGPLDDDAPVAPAIRGEGGRSPSIRVEAAAVSCVGVRCGVSRTWRVGVGGGVLRGRRAFFVLGHSCRIARGAARFLSRLGRHARSAWSCVTGPCRIAGGHRRSAAGRQRERSGRGRFRRLGMSVPRGWSRRRRIAGGAAAWRRWRRWAAAGSGLRARELGGAAAVRLRSFRLRGGWDGLTGRSGPAIGWGPWFRLLSSGGGRGFLPVRVGRVWGGGGPRRPRRCGGVWVGRGRCSRLRSFAASRGVVGLRPWCPVAGWEPVGTGGLPLLRSSAAGARGVAGCCGRAAGLSGGRVVVSGVVGPGRAW